MYDIAIIGAGVNGCSVAYEFTQEGKKVILFDMNSIAGGGSGAAGAFISPKFSKVGELKEMLDTAFDYSMTFYEKNFPKLLTKSPVLHIAKDEAEAEILRYYKKHTKRKLLDLSFELNESVSVNAGVVDASAMCEAMAKSAKFVKQEVKTLIYGDGVWVVNDTYSAKEVVLATGAYKQLIKEPYIKPHGIWGHRIDIQTSTHNANSLHQFVSISPSIDGKVAIGATHNVHYHPQTALESYDIQSGREELLQKASKTLKLNNIKILKDYTGLRSGSTDYMPLLGKLVMSSETLQNKTINFERKDTKYEKYTYYPNLYMMNGSGGYGFVLAPYLAKILKEYILGNKEISDSVSPARFFARWARRL